MTIIAHYSDGKGNWGMVCGSITLMQKTWPQWKCQQCGEDFPAQQKRKYCTRKCRAEGKKRKSET